MKRQFFLHFLPLLSGLLLSFGQWVFPQAAHAQTTCPDNQFLAQYYASNKPGRSLKFTRCETSINYSWGTGSPGGGLKSDNFSIRWTGSFAFTAGAYTFTTFADDGLRLWVDNVLLLDTWTETPPTTHQLTLNLTTGLHAIRVEYHDASGPASVQVSWQLAPPPSSSASIGTNLSPVVDWSSEWPFVDAFKTSRAWLTQCNSWQQSDCLAGWDTGEEHLLDLDSSGWVRSLPAPTDSPQYWFVGTLMFRGLKGHYPAGQYVVLYDGEGTLAYDFDAKKDTTASQPGRDVLNVTPSDNGIYLKVTATDPQHTGNYLRNIRVLTPGAEASYTTDIFPAQFLQRLAAYKTVRFMNWMRANDTTQRDWTQRPLPTDARYSTSDGVPLEVMLALANRLQAAPWFTLPHQATDDYLRQFAMLALAGLDRTRTVYVEYSNEIWNGLFSQGQWVEQQGQAAWPTSSASGFTKRINWYGKRAAEMCDIWKNAWGVDSNRIVCVMSGQAANDWVVSQALDCPLWSGGPCVAHGVNAIAIAPYFGYYVGAPENEATVQSWTLDSDGGLSRLFTELQTGGVLPGGPSGGALQDAARQVAAHATLASARQLKLLAYEGGQHLAGVGAVVNNPGITALFIAANRDPRMNTVYTAYLTNWQQQKGQTFVHFLNVDAYSQWGSWGALEYLDQTSTPKYDALMDFINANP
jgi:hypothetical protein